MSFAGHADGIDRAITGGGERRHAERQAVQPANEASFLKALKLTGSPPTGDAAKVLSALRRLSLPGSMCKDSWRGIKLATESVLP